MPVFVNSVAVNDNVGEIFIIGPDESVNLAQIVFEVFKSFFINVRLIQFSEVDVFFVIVC